MINQENIQIGTLLGLPKHFGRFEDLHHNEFCLLCSFLFAPLQTYATDANPIKISRRYCTDHSILGNINLSTFPFNLGAVPAVVPKVCYAGQMLGREKVYRLQE